MCGRYLLESNIEEIIKEYGIHRIIEFNYQHEPEIFPSNFVPVVVNEGKKELRLLKWGFSPQFSKNLIINARSETIEQKFLFKRPLLSKRCIVPANGFYEWKKENGKNTKYRITINDSSMFSIAGIYDEFVDKEGVKFSGFTIITAAANEAMAAVHDRMPAILERNDAEVWLDGALRDIGRLKGLLKPYYNDRMVLCGVDGVGERFEQVELWSLKK